MAGVTVTRRFALALATLSACNTPGICTTPCGVQLVQIQAGWTCPAFTELESVTLESFAAHVSDPAFQNSCYRLQGWNVRVEAEPDWISPEHVTSENPTGRVRGLTRCELGLMQVGNRSPFQSSLPHEMAHAIQACVPGDHENWADAGIYDAINEVRR